jgi:hypothetical protein
MRAPFRFCFLWTGCLLTGRSIESAFSIRWASGIPRREGGGRGRWARALLTRSASGWVRLCCGNALPLPAPSTLSHGHSWPLSQLSRMGIFGLFPLRRFPRPRPFSVASNWLLIPLPHPNSSGANHESPCGRDSRRNSAPHLLCVQLRLPPAP